MMIDDDELFMVPSVLHHVSPLQHAQEYINHILLQ